MEKIESPVVGDIIRSKAFAYGKHEIVKIKGVIYLNLSEFKPLGSTPHEDPHIMCGVHGFNGEIAPYSYLPDRRKALWIVIDAHADKESYNGDYWPIWRVKARRLNEDNTYNPEGEMVVFRIFDKIALNDAFSYQDIEIVGKAIPQTTYEIALMK